MSLTAFQASGWMSFPWDARVAAWVDAAAGPAQEAVHDPANASWMQCADTWFVGVDALPNDPKGAVAGGPVLDGPGFDLWRAMEHDVPPLHRAQVSVTYPGYPKPRDGESEGAFRYRLNRDAAHVDGLLPVGPDRRRKLTEPHAFILGLPLVEAAPEASPLVVWEGSHHVVARHLCPLFQASPPETWADLDVTEAYHAARREVFDTCPRITVPGRPGESVMLHHMCLHGVAPWAAEDTATDGRIVAYFRPEWPGGIRAWLVNAPAGQTAPTG